VSRRLLLALAVAGIGAAIVGAAALSTGGDEPRAERARATARAPDLRECRRLGGDLARACYTREYLAAVHGRDDPRPAVEAIAGSAWKEGPALMADCHGIMHTVGRTYAREAGVTLATLMERLPQSNDPGCTAGFAHGMVTAVAPDIDPERPGEAARICGAAGTRYQEYSCIHGFGHAFMRVYGDVLGPSLKLCRALGERAAADCAQGAYHDYWFAVAGADDTTAPDDVVRDPRVLCGAAPAPFVRPCWYRAWVENRPATFAVAAPEDLDALCYRLGGLQREACMTGAAVIGPVEPAAQLRLCARLAAASDAVACIRGTKVQNLLERPPRELVALVDGCARFDGATRTACYRWLGKAAAVLTDGRFAGGGCPRLRGATARRACAEGAATMDEALETFS
jgi:hypothetical protein